MPSGLVEPFLDDPVGPGVERGTEIFGVGHGDLPVSVGASVATHDGD